MPADISAFEFDLKKTADESLPFFIGLSGSRDRGTSRTRQA
jgi:hypothetical protein